MRYCIEEVVDEWEYMRDGEHYLRRLKAAMARQLAEKMLDVFGAKPVRNDALRGHRVMLFDVVIGEQYELDRAEQRGVRNGFQEGVAAAKAAQPWGFDEQYE